MLWENQRNELRQEFVQSCIEGDVVYDEKHLHQVLSVWMPASAAIGSVWSCWTPEAERRRCWTAAVSVKRWRIFLNHMAQGVRAYLLPRGRQWSILLNAATGSGIEQTVAELDALLKRAAREAGGGFSVRLFKTMAGF